MRQTVKCSARFLRACMWATSDLDEQSRLELILRRACMKLKLTTKEGCFTDPDVTAEYIEKCFGQTVWDAIWKEVSEANALGGVKLLADEFAFDITLPQDVSNMNTIFGVDTETSYYHHTEVVPTLYKHGKRAASGLRNSFACRAACGWVMAEYSAYCKDNTDSGFSVDAPYVWFTKEYERFTQDISALPLYTELVGGIPQLASSTTQDLVTQTKNHATYLAGLYAILCNLVTMRLDSKAKDDCNASWHNVWYYGTIVNAVDPGYTAQFNSLSLLDVIYLELARKVVSIHREKNYRLMYSPKSSVDNKIIRSGVLSAYILDGLKNRDFRLGGDLLEVILSDATLMTEAFKDKSAEEVADIFRNALRTTCYTDFYLSSLNDTRVCSNHRGKVMSHAAQFASIKNVKGVVTFGGDADGGNARHRYLYVNDCIDGGTFTQAIQTVKPSEKVKIIYVGVDDGPRILMPDTLDNGVIKANVEILDYATRTFVPLKDEFFLTGSPNISGAVSSLLKNTNLAGNNLSLEKKNEICSFDFTMSWYLIYLAMERIRNEEGGEWSGLIRMDDPSECKKKGYHATPYPSVHPFYDMEHYTKVGDTLPLTMLKDRPIYVLVSSLDSYYGLTSFGGVEIIVDTLTDNALLLKKDLFLSAVGLSDEAILKLSEGSRNGRIHQSYQLKNILDDNKDIIEDAVGMVVNGLKTHSISISPITLHNIREHTMSELQDAANRNTWSSCGIWEIKRLVFRKPKEVTA